MKVKLLTKDSQTIVEIELPEFKEGQRPEVIVWGDRVFHGKNSDRLYWEVFFYRYCIQALEQSSTANTPP